MLSIPRSKVDLDLMNNVKTSLYRGLEQNHADKASFNLEYVGLHGKYDDKSDKIKYNSSSDGVILTASKRYGSFTLGGVFGAQDSKVTYKEDFDGVKEKVNSTQFGIHGKYDMSQHMDVITAFTYSTNKHKFTTKAGTEDIHNAKYTSKIVDFDTRVGYKVPFQDAYVKPYIGLGIMQVKEGEIEKIQAKATSKTSAYGTLGVYAEMNFKKLDIFGNLEWKQRFSRESYHAKREHTATEDFAGLDYNRADLNASLGMKYHVTDAFKVNASYELNQTKNNAVKLGFGYQF